MSCAVNMTKSCKVTRVSNAVAAGTTTINSSVIDMSGFESVEFAVNFGAITAGAVTSVKIQHGDAANLSDAADLAGTGQVVADTSSNLIVRAELHRPLKRYCRVVVVRGTQNAVVDSITATQCNARTLPVTQDATVLSAGLFVSPAAGTP